MYSLRITNSRLLVVCINQALFKTDSIRIVILKIYTDKTKKKTTPHQFLCHSVFLIVLLFILVMHKFVWYHLRFYEIFISPCRCCLSRLSEGLVNAGLGL